MWPLAGDGIYAWVVLPLLIFLARICDVSLGTIRVIFVSRGYRYLAPVLGFFEISIWLLAIGQIMRDLNNIATYFAYAGGFAAGTFAGMWLEDRLSIGTVLVRVITKENASGLVQRLKAASYGLTTVSGTGSHGPVVLIFTIVRRSDLPDVIRHIRDFNPQAFYTIEDIREAREVVFPAERGAHRFFGTGLLSLFRKGK